MHNRSFKKTVNGEVNKSSKLDFSLGDNLIIMFVRWGWSPLKTAIVMSVMVVLADVIVALLAGRLLPGVGYRGLLVDLFWWVTVLINPPIIWGYYLWLYKAPSEVLHKLEIARVVQFKNADLQNASIVLDNHNPTRYAIVLAVLVGGLFYYQGYLTPPIWFNSNKVLMGIHVLGWVLTFYAAVACAFRLILNAHVYGKLLKNIVIHPFHPDRAGGLRPLGRYALATTYPIALIGTAAMFGEYWVFIKGEASTAFAIHTIVFLYFIFVPLVFVAPLWVAHDSMLSAKEDTILKISEQFNNDLSLAYEEITSNAKALKDNIEKIEQLKKLHELSNSFPVWPFDTETIKRFLVTMFSPLSGLIIPIVIDYIKFLFLRRP